MDALPPNPAGSDILGVVLALHRAPAMRFDLRGQPLPADLGLILRLAAPSQSLLDDTAARIGETPATLREAARFYLQQVLFEPGTDAYRVLGVAPDAAVAHIREHHQWLQRWLHPDRHEDDGSATFSARLNWAWQQLRDQRKRNAYDLERAQHHAPSPTHEPTHATPLVAKWASVPVARSARPGRWWRRGALGLAFGSCLVLFYLALTRDRPPVASPQNAAVAATASPPVSIEAPAAATELPRAGAVRTLASSGAPSRRVPPAALATIAHTRSPAPTAPAQTHVAQLAPAATLPVAPTLRTAAVLIAPSAPALQPQAAPNLSIKRPPIHALLASVHESVTAPPTAATTAATHAQSAPASTPPADPAVLLHRVELARVRARSVIAYFRSASHAVPQWRHAAAPFNAAVQRAALRQRRGMPDAANFALTKPVWRMRENRIAMDADYHVQHDQKPIEQGGFRLRMVWQDDAWQIIHVELVPRG